MVSDNPVFFFDIGIDGIFVGRIEMTLREDIVPKTVKNFVALCNAPRGNGYKGSIIHQIRPNFMIQGGDFQNGDGTGGISIYGEYFDDENFELRHEGPGTLSMFNIGPNKNTSQFCICTAENTWLDGRQVVFGKVTKGYEIVQEIESVRTDEEATPLIPITIIDCGSLTESKKNSAASSLFAPAKASEAETEIPENIQISDLKEEISNNNRRHQKLKDEIEEATEKSKNLEMEIQKQYQENMSTSHSKIHLARSASMEIENMRNILKEYFG